MSRVLPTVLRETASSILTAKGAPRDIAELVAESLVEAEMKGVHSHGLIRLKPYLQSIQNRTLVPNARPKIKSERGAVVVLEGNKAFGQLVGTEAMRLAVERARLYGMGCTGARRLHHSGVLEFITSRAAAAGVIGIAFNNTEPLMVPPGGKTKTVGNNPFSISVPSKSNPVTLDLALSVVARGKIREALFEGRSIEPGWAVDEDGNPTLDASKAMKGALLPLGSHKGYGIAFMIDVLAGILTSSATGPDIITWESDAGGQWTSGFIAMAIDPSFFVEEGEFRTGVSELVRKTKELQGGRKVYAPGEDRSEEYFRSSENGVLLSDKLVNELNEISRELALGIVLPV